MIHLSNLYLGTRFFVLLAVAGVCGAVGFWYAGAFYLGVGLSAILLLLTVYDTYLLYRSAGP